MCEGNNLNLDDINDFATYVAERMGDHPFEPYSNSYNPLEKAAFDAIMDTELPNGSEPGAEGSVEKETLSFPPVEGTIKPHVATNISKEIFQLIYPGIAKSPFVTFEPHITPNQWDELMILTSTFVTQIRLGEINCNPKDSKFPRNPDEKVVYPVQFTTPKGVDAFSYTFRCNEPKPPIKFADYDIVVSKTEERILFFVVAEKLKHRKDICLFVPYGKTAKFYVSPNSGLSIDSIPRISNHMFKNLMDSLRRGF